MEQAYYSQSLWIQKCRSVSAAYCRWIYRPRFGGTPRAARPLRHARNFSCHQHITPIDDCSFFIHFLSDLAFRTGQYATGKNPFQHVRIPHDIHSFSSGITARGWSL